MSQLGGLLIAYYLYNIYFELLSQMRYLKNLVVSVALLGIKFDTWSCQKVVKQSFYHSLSYQRL